MKHCNKCNTTKSVTEFSKEKYAKDGLRNRCRSCVAKYRKSRKKPPKPYTHNKYSRHLIGNTCVTSQGYNLTVIDGSSTPGKCTVQIEAYVMEIHNQAAKNGKVYYPLPPIY